MKNIGFFILVIFTLASCVTPNMKSAKDKLTEENLCKEQLNKEITRSWSWRLNKLSKEKGHFLIELFYRAEKGEGIVYSDQKKIQKLFGVWVKKGHAGKAVYTIFPNFLKKEPIYAEDFKVIEAWSKLYSYCLDEKIVENKFINEDRKEVLEERLDNILPWYVFSEDSVVDNIYTFTNDYFNSLLVNKSPKNSSFKNALGLHFRGFYNYAQNYYVKGKRYADAVKYAAGVSYFENRQEDDGFYASRKIVNKITEDSYCQFKTDEVDSDDALLSSAVIYQMFKTKDSFCQSGKRGKDFCSSILLSSLSQVTRENRNFSFDFREVFYNSENLEIFLEQFESKDLAKTDFTKLLLGRDFDKFSNLNCK